MERSERFWAEFNELFKHHGKTAARSGKEVSFGTAHIRREYLKQDFHRLRTGKLVKLEGGQVVSEQRFKLASPRNLKQKHIRALINDWLAREHSVAYLHNKLSVWRLFCGWIGKPNLVPGTAEVIADPKYQHRSQVARKDKSWSGCGIDVTQKIQEIAGTDTRVAMMLELMRVFSLRQKEASLLRPHLSDQKVYLDINRGTKGGRARTHKIDTPEERAVLERAKALVTDLEGCLIPQEMSLERWKNRLYFVLRKHGVNRKKLGTSTHGLRHEGLNKLYKEITGAKSPVQGGKPGDVTPETDRFARQQVAETAGHGKKSSSAAYLGSFLRDKKPTAEVPDPPSTPESTDPENPEQDDEEEDEEARQLIEDLRDQADSEEEIS
jgi:hypothetical protein